MIGILHHPNLPKSYLLGQAVETWLQSGGYDTWFDSVVDAHHDTENLAKSTLLIALGGDGSILRAGRAGALYNVPIFSVNLGRLGFLSESSPENWKEKLNDVLNGRYRLEKRIMLHAKVIRNGQQIGEATALNEVVVGRGGQARVLHIQLYVDGDAVTSYTADGLITATPTGSTAYALAAGGPILPPELPNFVIVPVAPHLSLDRAIVLYEKSVVKLKITFDHEANMTVDGQTSLSLGDGDEVIITKSPHTSLFTRGDNSSYFYKRLMHPTRGLKY